MGFQKARRAWFFLARGLGCVLAWIWAVSETEGQSKTYTFSYT